MSGQQAHPGHCDCLVIQMGDVMMRGKSFDAHTHFQQCFLKRLPVQMNPREPEVVGMVELRIFQAAGMKCFQEIVIVQVSR